MDDALHERIRQLRDGDDYRKRRMAATVVGAPGGGWHPVSGFSPLDLGPLAWFDATTLALADSAPVSRWPDLSGHGNDAVQATGASQPLYKAGIQNGLPVVRFDGVDDYLKSAVFAAVAQPLMLVAVAKANAGGYFAVIGGGVDGHINSIGTNPQFRLYAAGGLMIGAASRAGAWHLFEGLLSGAASVGWVDGAQEMTGNPGTNDLTSIEIGALDSGGVAADNWSGDIAEIVLYSRALTTPERQQLEAYGKAKWGTP